MILTRADAGTRAEMKAGEVVEFRLDDGPTSGYQWAVEQGGDEVLEPQGSDHAPSGKPVPGAVGTRRWAFQARAAGDGHLVFKRWRPWEGEPSVTERVVFDVRVTR